MTLCTGCWMKPIESYCTCQALSILQCVHSRRCVCVWVFEQTKQALSQPVKAWLLCLGEKAQIGVRFLFNSRHKHKLIQTLCRLIGPSGVLRITTVNACCMSALKHSLHTYWQQLAEWWSYLSPYRGDGGMSTSTVTCYRACWSQASLSNWNVVGSL